MHELHLNLSYKRFDMMYDALEIRTSLFIANTGLAKLSRPTLPSNFNAVKSTKVDHLHENFKLSVKREGDINTYRRETKR